MKQFGYVDYISQSKMGNAFLDNLRAGKLKGNRCSKCNTLYFPPRAYCTKVDLTDEYMQWEDLSGEGTIVSYSEVHIAPVGFERYVPYLVCVVDLKEGGRLIAWADASPDDMKVGDPVIVKTEVIAGNRVVYQILLGDQIEEAEKTEDIEEDEISTHKLKNKVAIITGAGKGIGKEIALEYGKEGAIVIAAARTFSDVEQVAQTIQKAGGKAFPIACDISKVEDVENMIKTTLEKFGKIDILVNNAGISRSALIHRTTDELWNQVVNINQKGTFNCIRAVIPHFMEKKPLGAKIINFTSTAAKHGNAGQSAYATSKWGIVALTKTAARELSSYSVQVNCIMPGYIETPMTADTPIAYKEQTISQIPLMRIGKPNDISKMSVFLASKDSDYMTGVVVQIDGGLRM